MIFKWKIGSKGKKNVYLINKYKKRGKIILLRKSVYFQYFANANIAVTSKPTRWNKSKVKNVISFNIQYACLQFEQSYLIPNSDDNFLIEN